MNIWNKVFLGLIFVVALVFAYLATLALGIHAHWRDAVAESQRQIQQAEEESERLLEGEQGIRDLQVEVARLMVDRGRVWEGCEVLQIDPNTGGARVFTDLPGPHQMTPDLLVSVIEATPAAEGGSYLGLFRVTAVEDEKTVRIEPATQLSPREVSRIAASEAEWRLYELLPIDDPHVFEDISEEQLRASLPAETADEYLRDGRPVQPDEEIPTAVRTAYGIPGRVQDGVFLRGLRDYQFWFRELRNQHTILRDLEAAAEHDRQALAEAEKLAQGQLQSIQNDIDGAKSDLAAMSRERDLVAGRLAHLESQLDEVRAQIDGLIESNLVMAAEIARMQLHAQRLIDARTPAVADASLR